MAPLIRQLIEEGAGEERGGVGYAEIEFDSPTLGDVAGRYGLEPISSKGAVFMCIDRKIGIWCVIVAHFAKSTSWRTVTLTIVHRLRVFQRC